MARPLDLNQWERHFAQQLKAAGPDRLDQGGALVDILPNEGDWLTFLHGCRWEWARILRAPEDFPASLVMLYAGIAFFEFGDEPFWDAFARVIEDPTVETTGPQSKLNAAYRTACASFGLRLIKNTQNVAYVGAAMHHVGIPLRLWPLFIDLCYWAQNEPGWKEMPQAQWNAAMGRFALTSRPLNRFLTGDRAEASRMIQELLDARALLANDADLPVEGAKDLCRMRPEYFRKAATSSFLRPVFLDVGSDEQPQLHWDGIQRAFKLHLPGIPNSKLPAQWRLGSKIKQVDVHPHSFQIDGQALEAMIDLTVVSNATHQDLPIAGLLDWGLFDEDHDEVAVARNRTILPVRDYTLIGTKPLQNLTLEGFDVDAESKNSVTGLADGTEVYVTKLYPNAKAAQLEFDHEQERVKIKFATLSKIEAKLYSGTGAEAFCLEHSDGHLVLDHLPLLALAVPHGHFDEDSLEVLQSSFKVSVNEAACQGTWKKVDEGAFDDKKLFVWTWGAASQTALAPFGSLNRGLSRFKVAADDQSFGSEFTVNMRARHDRLRPLVKDLPGVSLPLVLLAQDPKGMGWDELQLASDVLAPAQTWSSYALTLYRRQGILTKENRRWVFAANRATTTLKGGKLELAYVGDPSVLWAIIKHLANELPDRDLSPVEAVSKWGTPPYWLTRWPARLEHNARNVLAAENVGLGESLWNS